MVIFLDEPPPRDALARAAGQRDEAMHLGEREAVVGPPAEDDAAAGGAKIDGRLGSKRSHRDAIWPRKNIRTDDD